MKKIGIVAVALAALIMGFGANLSTQTADADVEGSVVIGCEFLIGAIDGNLGNTTAAADLTDACNDIDAGDVAALANVLGDEDDVLEVEDFEDLDLDDNQIQDGGTNMLLACGLAVPTATVCKGSTYVFAFVDNEGAVEFDADTGLTVDGFGGVNPELCDTEAQDSDCSAATPDDGDGVVVAIVDDGSADAGDEVDINIEQDGVSVDETIVVTGAADEVTIEVLGKDVLQEAESTGDFGDCLDEAEVTDTDQLSEPTITFVKSTVTDSDDVELTRVSVGLESDETDIADVEDDSGEVSDDPNGDTGITVASSAAGIGSFAVVCAGTDTGVAAITATINAGGAGEEDASVDITVVGAPDAIALTASPATIACDGTQTSTVTATVTDSEGNNVADGTDVNFSVVALGTANPINTDTTDGTASSTITPLSNASAGVTVIVTAGDAQSSIRVDCSLPIPSQPSPVASPTRPGGVTGPDTGNGGYIGQDSSAGVPLWTMIALGLGSVALVAGGMVTRKVSK